VLQALLTGTSMASPLAAGVGAVLMGMTPGTTFKTATLCQRLTDLSTQTSIQNTGDPQFQDASGITPNLIVYNGLGG
jgi:hypothetical protein